MISIKDVAKACGVTAGTVSRALNGKTGVSPKLKAKIIQTATELGYRRNVLASSLPTSRSHLIGLVVPDITNPYYSQIAKGVSDELRHHGYFTILCSTNRSRRDEKSYFDMLCDSRVDGVIIASVTAQPQDLQIFKDYGIRVMALENPLGKNVSCVTNDNYQGACELFEHIVKAGFERLVFALGSPHVYTSLERLRACRDVLAKNNMPHKLLAVEVTGSTFEDAFANAHKVFEHQPDAVFAINDLCALAFMQYAKKAGLKVPDDVKIAGFDDLPIAPLMRVPLTTVHQHKSKLGAKAAQTLLYELEHPDAEPTSVMLRTDLVVRNSF